MKLAKLILIIAAFSAVPVFGQTTNSVFEGEVMKAQKELLAKLTGKMEVEELFVVGSKERTVARKLNFKLTNRYISFSRKAAANLLYRSLRTIDLKPKRHKYTALNRAKKEVAGTNIYAMIPATLESNEYVVIGAHYDSVLGSPGANDNASGTALVYGVAAELAKLKIRTRNVIVVFFDQEEIGLVGSRAFAKKLKDDGLKIHSVHTVDQMGWDADGDKAIEIEIPTPELEKLYREEAAKLSITVHKTNVPSTDHTAFREVGFNAIGITEEYKNEDTTPHYHKSTDTYETIDFGYLASTTQLVFNVMKRLAAKH